MTEKVLRRIAQSAQDEGLPNFRIGRKESNKWVADSLFGTGEFVLNFDYGKADYCFLGGTGVAKLSVDEATQGIWGQVSVEEDFVAGFVLRRNKALTDADRCSRLAQMFFQAMVAAAVGGDFEFGLGQMIYDSQAAFDYLSPDPNASVSLSQHSIYVIEGVIVYPPSTCDISCC